MAKYGFLIDYEHCVGCHVCEMACAREHDRPEGESGIVINQVVPDQSGGRHYFIPVPTDHCNLCGKRLAQGRAPACAQNCWTEVIQLGRIPDLVQKIQAKPRLVLWAPR